MVDALRVIIVYKVGKAVVQLGLAALSLVALSFGLSDRIHAVVLHWHAHVNDPLSEAAATWLLREANPRHEYALALLLAGDGLLTAGEAWTLHRRYAWGPWVVAALTATPIPYEAARMIFEPTPVGLLIIAGNLLIFLYLIRIARRHSLAILREASPRAV